MDQDNIQIVEPNNHYCTIHLNSNLEVRSQFAQSKLIALELAEELLVRFDLSALRHELRVALTNLHPDADDFDFWHWYSLAVDEAIDLLKLITPAKSKPKSTYGRIDVESVRNRADILSIAEGYGLRLQKSGRNYKVCCPFHNDKTPSCVLYPSENRFYCFGCQADGDVITFVMKMEGVDFKSACHKVEGK